MDIPTAREQVYRCRCLILWTTGHQEVCYATVSADQPFCQACEARHPIYDDEPNLQVTAVPLDTKLAPTWIEEQING